MWTKRDFGMVAAAALATFGVTVGVFWPRVVTAVEDKAASTTEVKVPTLTMGNVQVTAALDKVKERVMVLTVKNNSNEKGTALFKATAMMQTPGPTGGRVAFSSWKQTWSNDYVMELEPN